MPLREYKCTAGHVFEQLVKHDGSDEPTQCKHTGPKDTGTGKTLLVACACSVQRCISAPASSFPGADSWRKGHAK